MGIKTYQKKLFFLIYKRHLNMIEKENNNHSTIIINNAKNGKFREKLKKCFTSY